MKKVMLRCMIFLGILSVPLGATDNDVELDSKRIKNEAKDGTGGKQPAEERSYLRRLWNNHYGKILTGAGVLAAGTAGYYGYNRYRQNAENYRQKQETERIQSMAN